MMEPPYIVRDVPLAPLTSLELGGSARWFASIRHEHQLLECLQWATSHSIPISIVAGGSNLVVADAGFEGLVLHIALRGLATHEAAAGMCVRAGAGEPWDPLVEFCVDRDLAGLECLSGIPGSVGATPIQNVGAYGTEVSEAILRVRTCSPLDGSVQWMSAEDCRFGYRQSRFKRNPGEAIVLEVEYRLRPGGRPTIRYAELRASLQGDGFSLGAVRRAVLNLRAKKSMLLDPSDPNRRSAGSFFTNPIVSETRADQVRDLAMSSGVMRSDETMPRYAAPHGVKLAAGWLIERAGIHKGMRRGPVGVSSAHALALVHHGGGTTAQLVELAAEIRDRVLDVFGVALEPEPVFVGVELPRRDELQVKNT